MQVQSTEALFSDLRSKLREAIVLHEAGASGESLRQAQRRVDACMRHLLSLGLATQQELLRLVATERSLVRGPATGEIRREPQPVSGFNARPDAQPSRTLLTAGLSAA